MNYTLKPCPFCGGEAEIWRAGGRKTAWVACMGRCATLVSKEHTTDAEAIAAWNRRAASAEPVPSVTDEMVDAAIAADSHASWWAGNNREGAEKRMRAALEAALAVEGTAAKPVAWRYRSPWIRPKQGLAPEATGLGPWRYTDDAATVDARRRNAPRDEIQPLYTTPPAGIREALEAILRRAYPNPERTLGECADELQFIEDIARAALRGQS